MSLIDDIYASLRKENGLLRGQCIDLQNELEEKNVLIDRLMTYQTALAEKLIQVEAAIEEFYKTHTHSRPTDDDEYDSGPYSAIGKSKSEFDAEDETLEPSFSSFLSIKKTLQEERSSAMLLAGSPSTSPPSSMSPSSLSPPTIALRRPPIEMSPRNSTGYCQPCKEQQHPLVSPRTRKKSSEHVRTASSKGKKKTVGLSDSCPQAEKHRVTQAPPRPPSSGNHDAKIARRGKDSSSNLNLGSAPSSQNNLAASCPDEKPPLSPRSPSLPDTGIPFSVRPLSGPIPSDACTHPTRNKKASPKVSLAHNDSTMHSISVPTLTAAAVGPGVSAVSPRASAASPHVPANMSTDRRCSLPHGETTTLPAVPLAKKKAAEEVKKAAAASSKRPQNPREAFQHRRTKSLLDLESAKLDGSVHLSLFEKLKHKLKK